MRFASPGASTRPRMVAGIDGSPNSLAALNRAAYLARTAGVGLDMVYVIPDRAGVAVEAAGFEMLDMCVRYVSARGLGPGPDQIVARGDPAQVLVQLSATADRLVIGGSVRSGPRNLLGGAVVPYCLAHAHCPVDVCADQRTSGARLVAHAGGDRR